MIRPLWDKTYLLNMPSHDERRKRLERLFKIYNANRSDPDMTVEELEELATLMKNQHEQLVPDHSKEILAFVDEVKRLVREHFEEALQKFQPVVGECARKNPLHGMGECECFHRLLLLDLTQ